MGYRDHEPIVLENFNGLWKRGDPESCPMDHFTDCNNITYFANGFRTREGLTYYPVADFDLTILNVVRIYVYTKEATQSLLVLDTDGNIYHTASPTPSVPILTVPGCEDFTFVGISNRAYISPIVDDMGMEDEFVYVYLGDGLPARKIAGSGPISSLTLAQGAAGDIEAGIRVFGVIYETNTGFQTKMSPLATITLPGSTQVDISSIPISPDSFVVARNIVASKAINALDYTGDPSAYELFFVPDGRIADNITTTLTVDFFDSELLDEASSLLDILEEVPAVINLNTYHDRMVASNSFGEYNPDVNLDTFYNVITTRVSKKGEPESFDAVTGLIQVPADGYKLTFGQEYRDVLYLFKTLRTYAYTDSGDDPSSWPLTIIDQGLGASVHGVGAILDSGGISVDFLFLVNLSGIFLFNGGFIKPELTWKIAQDWQEYELEDMALFQILTDPISKSVVVALSNDKILFGDYSEGLDHMKIKWTYWTFDNQTTTIAMIDAHLLVIGSKEEA